MLKMERTGVSLQRLKVVGIVFSPEKDRVLVIERYKDSRHYFVFPGGGVDDKDNSLEEALLRELKEEANVEVRIACQPYFLDVLNHSRQVVFVCDYVKGQLKVTGIEKLRQNKQNKYIPGWLKINDLPKVTVYPLEIRDWVIKDLRDGRWRRRWLRVDSFDKLRNE